MINIGIGMGWAKAIYSVANNLIANFKARVATYSNSIFEAGPCLDTTLEELNAIGLLDNASLVITPNAYNETKLYSVVPNTTLGDMDVVRATTATRVNEQGLVELMPRNLLTYSNDFSNAIWTKTNTTISVNSILSPDGKINATKLIEDSTNNSHYIAIASVAFDLLTASIYLKKGERTFCKLFCASTGREVVINLDTKTIVSKSSDVTATITDVGNGWIRATMSKNFSYAFPFFIYTMLNATTMTYLGNGTSGIYIYGAQMEYGTTATDYFPTTTRINIPRLDYTNGTCPSILVEPQRTNLVTYSEQFNDASWTKYNSSIISATIISPDGSLNAKKIIDNSSNTSHVIYKMGITGTNQTVTYSVFAKAGEYNFVALSDNTTGQAVFNLTNGENTYSDVGITANKSVYYGNGWWRLSINFTVTTARGATININTNGTLSGSTFIGTGTSGVYIWGAQLEAGSYPTSYIPTVASTVTRNADVISKTGISSLIGQTEGTIYFDFNRNLKIDSGGIMYLSDGGINQIYFTVTGNDYLVARCVYNNNFSQILYPFALLSKAKLVLKYSGTTYKFWVNGIYAGSNTILGVPQTNQISFAQNGYTIINKALVFKTALTDAECLTLSTL